MGAAGRHDDSEMYNRMYDKPRETTALICVFYLVKAGAPSGFRTPDPLIKSHSFHTFVTCENPHLPAFFAQRMLHRNAQRSIGMYDNMYDMDERTMYDIANYRTRKEARTRATGLHVGRQRRPSVALDGCDGLAAQGTSRMVGQLRNSRGITALSRGWPGITQRGFIRPTQAKGDEMPYGMRDRLAFWLERFGWLHPVLLRYDGEAPGGRQRYENRLNGHLVVKS